MNRLMNWSIAISLAATLTACSDGGPLAPADGITPLSPGVGTASAVCTTDRGPDSQIQVPGTDAATEDAQDRCSEDEKPVLDPRIHTRGTSG